jgi:hypothetical protein
VSQQKLIEKSNKNWLRRKVRKKPVSKLHPWYQAPTQERRKRREKILRQLETGIESAE